MNKLYNDTAVHAIANAIRTKNGSSDTYTIAEMSTALNDLSYYAKPTISNVALATFEADGLPLNKLKVGINAVQDLHGYDHPWVGGVGKNKLPMTVDGIKAANTSGTWSGNSYTLNNIEITILTDGDENVLGFKVNGTTNVGTTFNICDGISLGLSGDYKFCGDSDLASGVAAFTYKFNVGSDINVFGNTVTKSISGNLTHMHIFLWGGMTFSNTIYQPQLQLSSVSDETFEPYSNICPISGWDEANVSDVDDVDNPTVTQTTTISLGQTVYGAEVDVVNGVLRITWKSVDMGSLAWSYSAQNVRFSTSGLQSEIKSGSNQDEIMCSCYNHVVNADMSVYKASNGLVFAKDSNYTDAATFKQSVTGQQFAYMLETPIIVPLTPTLIKSLNGQNNIYADTGEVIELEYFKEV